MINLQWTRESLAGRLSLYFGVGTLLTFCCLGTILFVVVERQVQLRDSNELSSKTVAVEQLLNDINQASDIDRLVKQIRATEIGHQDLDIGILIDSEWVLEPERSISDYALQYAVVPDAGIENQNRLDIDGKQWAVRHFAHQMTSQPRAVLQAVVAIDVTQTTHLVASLRNALIALGFAGAAMIAALTWVATARALAPLKRVAQAAERMTAEALDQPLSEAIAPIEVRGLVASINQMLSRLQKSFSSLEQFSADIAHELRTPVNAIDANASDAFSRAILRRIPGDIASELGGVEQIAAHGGRYVVHCSS